MMSQRKIIIKSSTLAIILILFVVFLVILANPYPLIDSYLMAFAEADDWTHDFYLGDGKDGTYLSLNVQGNYTETVNYVSLQKNEQVDFTYKLDAVKLSSDSGIGFSIVDLHKDYYNSNPNGLTEKKPSGIPGGGPPEHSGTDVAISLGQNLNTLSGRALYFETTIKYVVTISFQEEMISAINNGRVEFNLSSVVMNYLVGETELNLMNGSKSATNVAQTKYSIKAYIGEESEVTVASGTTSATNNGYQLTQSAHYTNSNNWHIPVLSQDNTMDIIIEYTAGYPSTAAYYTDAVYASIESVPEITLSMRYNLSDVEFTTNDATFGNILSPDQGGSKVYSVDLESKYGGYELEATAIPNDGYCFLYWKSDQNAGADNFETTMEPVALYEHNITDAPSGRITYQAVFEKIKITDLHDGGYSNYIYNNTGQGPRAYLDYAFSYVNHHIVSHSYGGTKGETSQTGSGTDSTINNIKPKTVGLYSYSVVFTRQIQVEDGVNTFEVGRLTNISYNISKYTPTGYTSSLSGNGLATYYYGQLLTDAYINKTKDGNGVIYLSDTFISGINNKINGDYYFVVATYNEGIRLTENPGSVKIKFVPTDTKNIESIELEGTLNLSITKTTLELGYIENDKLVSGLDGLSFDTLVYGQLRDDLDVTNKIVLYNPYTYDMATAIDNPFGAVRYSVINWGGISERPAITTSTQVTLQFQLNGNIPSTNTPSSLFYNLPTSEIKITYTVEQANLVFEQVENHMLKFSYTPYGNSQPTTVYQNINLMYGQGLGVITIAQTGNIFSNVSGYIDTGKIKFTWYRQNGDNSHGEILTDYYEEKLLQVVDSTNPNSLSNKNYYCIKAEWTNIAGNATNSNYAPYYFYNQSITIAKAKLNSSINFELSQENSDIGAKIPVIKPITYGTIVQNALSTQLNVGKTLNVINQDLDVYYKIDWIIDAYANSIGSLTNYPYALVSDSKQYPVKISIFKNNGAEWVIDSDNYEQDGEFIRNDFGQAFALATLTVNHSEQYFYVNVGGVLKTLNNNNLTQAIISYNSNIYEETTDGLSVGTDNDIDIETLYIEGNNTFNIIIYTTAVIYKANGKYASIDNKASVLISAINPNNYNNVAFFVSQCELENSFDVPYTKIIFTLSISAPAKTEPGIVSIKIGQYDSGTSLINPSGGNYRSKEWDPYQEDNDPYTLFVKLNKKPDGLKAANIRNPDDNQDPQLYSYVASYGNEISIEPNASARGVLAYVGDDGKITIKDESNISELYIITASSTGSYKLTYTADGHVNVLKPLENPYMPVNEEIWIYISKKTAIVNLLFDAKTEKSITYGEASPEISYGTSDYFASDDFDYIKNILKLTNLANQSIYSAGLILDVGNYNIGAGIDNDSVSIIGLTNEQLAKARDIANRYKITFNTVELKITKKTVTITFNNEAQYEEIGEFKVFTINYFDDGIKDANEYEYSYIFDGIINKDVSIDVLIPNIYLRPSVSAMMAGDSDDYYPISARPNVGDYTLMLYVPNDCPATNYDFVIERAKLVVAPRYVNLDFKTINQDYTSSSFDFLSNINLTGVKGASSPTGTLDIKYLKTGTIVNNDTVYLNALQHAGTYDVIVSYTSGNPDNYQYTSQTYNKGVIINRIDPTIILPSYDAKYTADEIKYLPTIKGVATDYNLTGTIQIFYSPINDNEFTNTIPKNSGTYFVKITYTSSDSDDYNSLTVTSETAIINISKADLIISSNTLSNKLNKNYDGKYIVLNDIVVSGVGDDGTFDLEYLDITYQKTGTSVWTEWTTNDTPINADKYDVELKYNADLNASTKANYNVTIQSYRNGAIEILKSSIESIALKITTSYTKTYDGERKGIVIDPSTIDINIGIKGSDVTLTEVSYSNISITYAKVTLNENTYSIGSYSSLAPVDAGDYVVRLRYNSNGSGNYADSEYYISEILTEEVFSQNVKITISKATPKIICSSIKLPYNSKAQTFTRYSISGVSSSDKPVGGFEVSYKITGTLDAWSSEAPYKINKYDIKIVFKAASTGNYTDADKEFTSIFEITNGNVTVTLYLREENYQGVQVNAANPTILKPDGTAVEEQYITIEYRLHDDENTDNWNMTPPTDSGWYDIRIHVEASETYIEYLNIFNNILRIKNPLPEFSMVSYSKTYDSV
ncbi:MAG: hypothetical protein LBF68_08095, partial [Christensenellaceae bacterium]|nr:hypothetical protein [Christensenellaceae bacterium]